MNILDTNIFNRLLDLTLSIDDLPPGRYVATHIQLDEIRSTPDSDRRAALEEKFQSVVDDMEPTASFILDVSRLDNAKLGDGIAYERIRAALDVVEPNRTEANIRDALIGEMAIKYDYVLVTADRALAGVVRDLGGEVIEFA